jgi:chemotaxis family two-component system sensor kinase Cph1
MEVYHDSPGAELIPALLESVRRIQALIADVLVYSHIVHRSELTLAEVDTNAVLEHVLLSCRATIEANEAIITRDPLPSVYADDAQLGRVLQNLISNAIKYRCSSRPPRIHVSAVSGEDEWQFEVADNGIGFDPQYSEYIFGLLKRLHGQGEYGGSGMGLAICKRIVEGHGGHIWAISEPQCGTHFFFTLPRGPL